jgi:hypothetical protein
MSIYILIRFKGIVSRDWGGRQCLGFFFIIKLFSYRTFEKWRLSGCALTLDFSEEQDFPEYNLITFDHMGKNWFYSGLRTPLEQPHFTSAEIALRRGALMGF